MDPLTLFALANGAVSAIKAGCKLYKDIKGAAGDIKDVLKDLDEQFHGNYAAKGKKPPPEAIKQFNEEKSRIKDLNKKDTGDIYFELGQHLGAFFDNQAKCIAVFEAEEKRSYDLYTGDDSVGKRALQRVLMQKKLEQMEVELREVMIYQSPPELGNLYTRVNQMRVIIIAEQEEARLAQEKKQREVEWQRRKVISAIQDKAIYGVACLVFVLYLVLFFSLLIMDRKVRWGF